MAYAFRIVEHRDGSFSYLRGREDLLLFSQLDDALDHATVMASEQPPSSVLLHHLEGHVEVIATFD